MTIGELKAIQEKKGLPDSTRIVSYNQLQSGTYTDCLIWQELMIYIPEKDLFLEKDNYKFDEGEIFIVVS